MKRRIVMLCVLLFFGLNLGSAGDRVFSADEHGVAYRTTTTMFFFAKSEVVGRSAQATAQMHFPSEDSLLVEVRVSVNSFDSGNRKRDTHVVEILKGEEFPNIRFISMTILRSDFQRAVSLRKLMLPGMLEIAGQSFPIEFPLIFSQENGFMVVEGSLNTSFSAFDIKVPSVGPAGVISAPSDELEILVHLRVDRIKGIDKILNPK
jgi:polyisoprenoid-binding protein YceI